MSSSTGDDLLPLHIDFQEGWLGQDVVLVVNGNEQAVNDVRTRLQVGLARQVVVDVPVGTVTVTVEVPSEGLRSSHEVQCSSEHFVAVSLLDGQLVFADQARTYGYV